MVGALTALPQLSGIYRGERGAVAVLLGISLDLLLDWWWADPIAGYVIVYYAIREAVHIFRPGTSVI